MELTSPVLELAALLKYGAWVALLIGALLFHLRLRIFSSLLYLLSAVAITAWSNLGRSMLYGALSPHAAVSTAGDLAIMGQAESVVALVDAGLALVLGASLLFAVRAVRRTDRHAA
jgi:hypothetical protein